MHSKGYFKYINALILFIDLVIIFAASKYFEIYATGSLFDFSKFNISDLYLGTLTNEAIVGNYIAYPNNNLAEILFINPRTRNLQILYKYLGYDTWVDSIKWVDSTSFNTVHDTPLIYKLEELDKDPTKGDNKTYFGKMPQKNGPKRWVRLGTFYKKESPSSATPNESEDTPHNTYQFNIFKNEKFIIFDVYLGTLTNEAVVDNYIAYPDNNLAKIQAITDKHYLRMSFYLDNSYPFWASSTTFYKENKPVTSFGDVEMEAKPENKLSTYRLQKLGEVDAPTKDDNKIYFVKITLYNNLEGWYRIGTCIGIRYKKTYSSSEKKDIFIPTYKFNNSNDYEQHFSISDLYLGTLIQSSPEVGNYIAYSTNYVAKILAITDKYLHMSFYLDNSNPFVVNTIKLNEPLTDINEPTPPPKIYDLELKKSPYFTLYNDKLKKNIYFGKKYNPGSISIIERIGNFLNTNVVESTITTANDAYNGMKTQTSHNYFYNTYNKQTTDYNSLDTIYLGSLIEPPEPPKLGNYIVYPNNEAAKILNIKNGNLQISFDSVNNRDPFWVNQLTFEPLTTTQKISNFTNRMGENIINTFKRKSTTGGKTKRNKNKSGKRNRKHNTIRRKTLSGYCEKSYRRARATHKRRKT